MLAILVFIMATLTKKTVGRKGPFGGTFSKIGLHIDYDNSHGGLGHQVQESWPYLSNVTLSPYLLSHVKNEFSPVEFRDSPLQKRERDWAELTFAKTSGNVTINKEKNGQQLTGASPITIPETIAGQISAPVPLWFVKW